jgi:hypothetical protein
MMAGKRGFFMAKDFMKIKTPAPVKPEREPRIDCRPTNYSEAALLMMEKATGQRFARTISVPKPVAPQAVDSE